MEEKSEECKHCRTSEEEIYWKHFTSIHFFLTLPSHFHDHLELPLKFSAHMKSQVPDRVSLKGPSGASWDIEVLKYDDLIFVGKEWKDFVKVNCLKENCLLVFKYVRNSTFEVLIFDQESYCEKESTYFVKNCKHTLSDQEVRRKKVGKDAQFTEIIEDDAEKETSLVASKKLRLDDEAEDCSEKENAATSTKGLLAAASKRGHKPTKRKAQSTKRSNITEKAKEVSHTLQRNLEKDELHKSEALFETRLNGNDVGACLSEKVNAPSPGKGVISEASKHGGKPRKRKAQSTKKSIINEKDKEVSQISQINVSNPDNGEIYLKRDDPNVSKALLKKSLNEDYMITLESAEDTPASNESQRLKAQSDKQQSWNVTTSEPRQVSEMNLILIENEENCRALYSHNLEAQFGKSLSGTDTSNEPCLITPENGEDTPFLFCSRKTNVQAGDYHSSKSHGKRGTGSPKKQVLSKSSKELVSKSASDRKKSRTKVISNRRPVTETEKANALQRAKEKQTEDGFAVVMRRMNLHPRFFLHMPAKCLHKHPLQENQEVVLYVGEKIWHTCYRSYGTNYRGLTAGWKNFVLDNMLEEFDVLVFKPVSQKDEAAFAMHVDIFRVV